MDARLACAFFRLIVTRFPYQGERRKRRKMEEDIVYDEEVAIEEETRIERLADAMVEAAEFNAWEYGNTGNLLIN